MKPLKVGFKSSSFITAIDIKSSVCVQIAFIFWIRVIIVYETALLTIQAWMLLNNYF